MESLQKTISEIAQKKGKVRMRDVLAVFGDNYSRQYVHRIIKKMVDAEKLLRGGSHRNAFYVLPEDKHLLASEKIIKKALKRDGMEEHLILDEIQQSALYADMKENIRSVFNYAFSEILNNAIDHSQSDLIDIEIYKSDGNLVFMINDYGIGVFRNVKKEKQLKSELFAIQEIMKGKTTTQPLAHSGQGIFFTSKIADKFVLESYEYALIVDNLLKDVFVGENKSQNKGTRVIFTLNVNTHKHLIDLFRKFETNKDTMEFDTTQFKVKLFTMGTVYVSRSQARRVLEGLEKFKKVILDFDQVPMIGQGFADEIFRVYKIKHPEIEIVSINMNEAVRFMIGRVEKPNVE
jgi:anti-sigma regulatory factor (Ser/Thr protein kinase)